MLAAPPRDFDTEWARTAVEGSGCVGNESVWVRKSVPHAKTRKGRWFDTAVIVSCVSRRSLAILRENLTQGLGGLSAIVAKKNRGLARWFLKLLESA